MGQEIEGAALLSRAAEGHIIQRIHHGTHPLVGRDTPLFYFVREFP
jgi:hypothetical protein